jgi:hypothetical protein
MVPGDRSHDAEGGGWEVDNVEVVLQAEVEQGLAA